MNCIQQKSISFTSVPWADGSSDSRRPTGDEADFVHESLHSLFHLGHKIVNSKRNFFLYSVNIALVNKQWRNIIRNVILQSPIINLIRQNDLARRRSTKLEAGFEIENRVTFKSIVCQKNVFIATCFFCCSIPRFKNHILEVNYEPKGRNSLSILVRISSELTNPVVRRWVILTSSKHIVKSAKVIKTKVQRIGKSPI